MFEGNVGNANAIGRQVGAALLFRGGFFGSGIVEAGMREPLAEGANCFAGRTLRHDRTVVEHDRVFAYLAHEIGRVRNDENRAAFLLEACYPVETLALK